MSTSEAKIEERRRQLAAELATLYVDNDAIYKRVTELKALLKQMATEAGESIKEVVPGKGTIRATGDKEGPFKGSFPVVQEKAYFDLTEKRRAKLAEDGIIIMTPTRGRPVLRARDVRSFLGCGAVLNGNPGPRGSPLRRSGDCAARVAE